MHRLRLDLANPGETTAGYSPIGFVRSDRSACRISGLNEKMEDPHSLKSNEMTQCSFLPQRLLAWRCQLQDGLHRDSLAWPEGGCLSVAPP